MLEACGLVVRSIPFYEWNSLEDLEHQKEYLTRLLASVTDQLPANLLKQGWGIGAQLNEVS